LSVVGVARPRAFFLFLIGALLFAPLFLVRPAEAAGSASISGQVTDHDGQPVAGVTVQVDGPGVQLDTPTDGEGRYVADGLPPGQYAVCFLPSEEDLARECWEDIEPITPRRTRVEVSDGQAVTGVNAVLEPTSHLRGTVTDSQGLAVEGVFVSTSWQPFGDDQPVSWWSEPVVTAADGSFDTGPLPSGWYMVRFSDTGSNRYATEWWKDAPTASASTRIRLDRGESVDGLDGVLADLAHITGRVTGANGSAASGATVRVFRVTPSHSYDEVGSGSALATGGRYEIALQPGTYRLAFDAAPGKYRTEFWRNARSVETAQDVVITGTTSVTDLDAALDLAPPVELERRPTITGRVRVGERLRVTDGAWDVRSLRFTYQWRADGVAIPRATEPRLRITPKLRGKHITVRVTATATADERSPGHAMTRRTAAVAARAN
jgi:Carboxypeptidase regulatory-like domain